MEYSVRDDHRKVRTQQVVDDLRRSQRNQRRASVTMMATSIATLLLLTLLFDLAYSLRLAISVTRPAWFLRLAANSSPPLAAARCAAAGLEFTAGRSVLLRTRLTTRCGGGS